MTDETQPQSQGFNPYEKSAPTTSQVPDRGQTDLKAVLKNYIRENPHVIAELINDQYPELREQLLNLNAMERMGLDMAKSKFPPLGALLDAIQSGEFAPGQAFDPKPAPNPTEPSRSEFEATVTNDSDGDGLAPAEVPDEVWDEAITYMAQARNKGYAYALIAEKVWVKYRIGVTPADVRKYVMQYEEGQTDDSGESEQPSQPEPSEQTDPAKLRAMQRVNQALIENRQLKARVEAEARQKELTDAIQKGVEEALGRQGMPLTPAQTQSHKGLIRKLWAALW